MYAARVNDQKLTFAVSGQLWNRSLVMQDLQTKSFWSHILGQAMEGDLKGAELEIIPSAMMDWDTWRSLHTNTTVLALSRTAKEFELEFHLRPNTFVLGLVIDGQAVAYSFDRLQEQPLLNDEVEGVPILILFDPASTAAQAFDRRVKERTLTFSRSSPGRLIDTETSSHWDPATGRCLQGTLEGARLKTLPAIVSFRKAWERFHPASVSGSK